MKRTLALLSLGALLTSGAAMAATGGNEGQKAPSTQNTPATGSVPSRHAECERPINWCLSSCERPDGLTPA